MGPRVVAFKLEVLVAEAEDVLDVGVDDHARQRARRAGELQAGLLQMVEVEVGVACGMDEVAGTEAADLRHHHEQKGVGGDVERHAKEGVSTTLVELEAEASVSHVELKERVAGGQVHVRQVGHVPRADNHAARVGRLTDIVDDVANLVDVTAVVVGPRPPLISVNVPEVTVCVGPFVPNTDTVFLQVADVGVTVEEP